MHAQPFGERVFSAISPARRGRVRAVNGSNAPGMHIHQKKSGSAANATAGKHGAHARSSCRGMGWAFPCGFSLSHTSRTARVLRRRGATPSLCRCGDYQLGKHDPRRRPSTTSAGTDRCGVAIPNMTRNRSKPDNWPAKNKMPFILTAAIHDNSVGGLQLMVTKWPGV